MNYSKFFQKFYLSRREGGIVGFKSKTKIPEFFFENALEEQYQEVLPLSESTYSKWFDGTRNPDGNIWASVNGHFDDDRLLKQLLRALNEAKIRQIMQSFGIELPVDEAPNKRQFAIAIKEQFHALAAGNGTADNIVPETYKKSPEPAGFKTYLRGATDNYKYVKLPGGKECLLSDVFVCNNIGTSAAVFPHRIKGNYIEDATLEKLRSYDRRGEVRRVILIGGCGYGKTLMLKHLFLKAAERSDETGRLPILAELRNYLSRDEDLLSFIVATVQEYDPTFTEKAAVDVLCKGQAQVLLDGLDELDPGEVKPFQRKLAAFAHRFPDSQIVIASRQCSAISGITNFIPLYLHPLDEDQVNELLDKLLVQQDSENAKSTVLSFFDDKDGYVKRTGFVATNPMLLTVIVNNYEKLKDINKSKTAFYEILYDALIRGHDEEKEAFDRIFHSVENRDEFTQVFRSFCALTFMDGIFELDSRKFEKYFKEVKKREDLSNPNKFSKEGFHYDVCATACMMYEQESGIYYIDPGFQDYFFAEYYYFEDTETTKRMGDFLLHRKLKSFRNLDGLRMLYQMSPEKVEVCLFLPFLDTVFDRNNEEETFIRLISYGYGECIYVDFDETVINTCLSELKAQTFDYIPDANPPKNIIMALLLDVLHLNNTFVIGAGVDKPRPGKYTTHFLTGFFDPGKKPGDHSTDCTIRAIKNEIQYLGDDQYFADRRNVFTEPIKDDSGTPVCFGYVYKVDPISLLGETDQLEAFIDMAKAAGLYDIFLKIENYYKEITERQKENDFR